MPPINEVVKSLDKKVATIVCLENLSVPFPLSVACVMVRWLDILDPNAIYAILMCVICAVSSCHDPIMIGMNKGAFIAWMFHNLYLIRYMLTKAQVLICDLLQKC